MGPDGLARVRGHRAVHLRKVLRVEPGSAVRVGLCRGATGVGRVVTASDDTVELELELGEPTRRPDIGLILAVPRPKVMKRVLATVASLGVTRIDLVNAWRVEKAYFSSPLLTDEAIRASLWEGLEQGGLTWLPDVMVHRRLMGFFEERAASLPAARLLAHPRSGRFVEEVAGSGPLAVAIGPEGGWIEREVATFLRAGFLACDLGLPVLRVETAVPALWAQLAMHRRRA